MNNYMDMTRDVDPNKHAYAFWRDKVRQRINDPETRELLAPMEAPHPFGAKRLSLEQVSILIHHANLFCKGMMFGANPSDFARISTNNSTAQTSTW